jgi:hypothetical protein
MFSKDNLQVSLVMLRAGNDTKLVILHGAIQEKRRGQNAKD